MELKDNSQRAKNASAYLLVGLIWTFIATLIGQLLPIMFNHEYLLEWTRISGIISIIISLITAIGIIQWFRRAYFNLHQRVTQLRFNEGWAAGSWFVPILNLIRPYVIMRELWSETIKIIGITEDTKVNSAKEGNKLINTWWACWIGTSVISQLILLILRLLDNTTSFFQYYIYIDWAVIIAKFSAGVLLIIIIRKYAILEKYLWTRTDSPIDSFGKQIEDENWE